MKQTLIPLEDRQRWERALSGLRFGFGHSWESCAAFEHTRKDLVFLCYSEGAAGRAAMPVVIRRRGETLDTTTPFGFSGIAADGDCHDLTAAWRGFCMSQGWIATYALQHPYTGFERFWRKDDCFHEGSLFWLDLSIPSTELLMTFSRLRHRQIRRWEKNMDSITEDREQILAFVLSEVKTFYTRKAAVSAYNFSPETWRMLCRSDRVMVLGACMEGRLVAVTLFGMGSDTADALFNISIPEGRDAATILMWEGAKRLAERGIVLLNMGGGVKPNDSVENSKRRFNGIETPLLRVKIVADPLAYAAACKAAGCDPSSRAGYFPPYHKPSVDYPRPPSSSCSYNKIVGDDE